MWLTKALQPSTPLAVGVACSTRLEISVTGDLPNPKDGRANDGHYPMHRSICRPPKPEDSNWYQYSSKDGWRQAKLWLAGPWNASFSLQAMHETIADAVPHRISEYPHDQPHKHAGECQSYLPEIKAMVCPEYERKGSKEEVQNTQ